MFSHLNQLDDERTKQYQRKNQTSEKAIKGDPDRHRYRIIVFLRTPDTHLHSPQGPNVDTPEIRLGKKATRGIDLDLIGGETSERLRSGHTPDRNCNSSGQTERGSEKHSSRHQPVKALRCTEDRRCVTADQGEDSSTEPGDLAGPRPQ